MKLQELLLTEMPAFSNKEMPPHPEQLTHFYSDDTIAAEWIPFTAWPDGYQVFMHKNHTTAFIGIKSRRQREPEDVPGWDALVTAEFKIPQDLSSNGVQLPGALQIDIVEAHSDAARRFGLGTRLYWGIADAGITVISDNKQYKGGKALWIKLARDQGSKYIVNVIQDGNVMMDKNNQPLVWDGSNVDETDLWNPSIKSAQFYTLFILRKR